jgi:hypothetical protein
LLVAFGASLYFPTSRAKVLEAGEPVLTPMLTWSTKGEMRKITRELETHERSLQSLPAVEVFPEWLSHKYHSESGRTDSWGNEYQLKVWADSFAVVSPGMDGILGTPDDLKASKERVSDPSRRRR